MGTRVGGLVVLAVVVAVSAMGVSGAASSEAVSGSSGYVVAQGDQNDAAYAVSGSSSTNVFATTQATSCYLPEVSAKVFVGPASLGYDGESDCPGATTGEDLGPYPTQTGSNAGYPMTTPQLVKDHSESDIRVDPTDPRHLIGTSKWFVSAEGYNHQLGFYESFDRGQSWPVQGHIPGYEGWTDNTDPVGAFDTYGDFYVFNLAYQFFYNKDGGHNFSVGKAIEPNPAQPAEVVAVSVRPHGAAVASDWRSTYKGKPDIVAAYDSVGNEPDKQWMTIDTTTTPTSHTNRIYLMWVNFHFVTPVPYVSYATALPGGTHTDWSTPQPLPEPPHTPTGATYLLPHVAPNGDIYTTVTNFDPAHSYSSASIFIDKSTDGGQTWKTVGSPIAVAAPPPATYANTTFRDGIEDTFAVGTNLDAQGFYPLYVAYEDYSAGVGNVLLAASYDGGAHWSTVQVNDNLSLVDEFQPNLAVAPDGTVSVAFYDRRLACPATAGANADPAEAAAAGVGPTMDSAADGATNYCVNASVQFYTPSLQPLGHNIRLTQHTWDPQLNAPHTSCATCRTTFIGDYFGNDATGSGVAGAPMNVFTFVSTYNDGTNPHNRQQQVVAQVPIP